MLLSRDQWSLLRIAGIARILVLTLALLTQTTRLEWSTNSSSASPSALHGHYDASSQLLFEHDVERVCPHADRTQRWLLSAVSFTAHWDGPATRSPLPRRLLRSAASELAATHFSVTLCASCPCYSGIHFMTLAESLDYSLEKESAFSPGLPLLTHAVARVMQAGELSRVQQWKWRCQQTI